MANDDTSNFPRSRDRAIRQTHAVTALLLVPVGLATKLDFASGTWIAANAGGVLYVMFWSLLVGSALPRSKPTNVCVTVLGLTCIVEVLQMVEWPWLEALRATRPGQLLLGSTFSWVDFPFYAAGALSSWLLMQWLRSRSL